VRRKEKGRKRWREKKGKRSEFGRGPQFTFLAMPLIYSSCFAFLQNASESATSEQCGSNVVCGAKYRYYVPSAFFIFLQCYYT